MDEIGAAAAPAELAGLWTAIPTAPVEWRLASVAVWAGSEVIIWGGAGLAPYSDRHDFFGDGAAYSPATRSWRRISDGPLSARRRASAVWTGREVLLWGGAGVDAFLADGAAYDPARDRWRKIAPSPLSPRSSSASVWTGEEMLIFGGSDNAGPLADAAAYDPAADSWRAVSTAPLALDQTWAPGAVWAGDGAAVWADSWDAEPLPAASYDPVTDAWAPLPEAGIVGEFVQQLVWTGEELLALTVRAPASLLLRSLADGADEWEALSDVPGGQGAEPAALWTEDGILVLADRTRPWRYREGSWEGLPPGGPFNRWLHTALWTGEELVILGESTLPDGSDAHDGRVFRFQRPIGGEEQRAAEETRWPTARGRSSGQPAAGASAFRFS